jgi:hypothetical protein
MCVDPQHPGQRFERGSGLYARLAQHGLHVVEGQVFLLRRRLPLFHALL